MTSVRSYLVYNTKLWSQYPRPQPSEHFPLTFNVVLITLWHYLASV